MSSFGDRNGESARIATILAAGRFVCPACKKERPVAEFPVRKGKRAFSWCVTCYATRNESNQLFRNYGISIGERETLLAFQGGKCAMCGRPPKTRRLCMDHEHSTGRLRGGLCHLCNRILGLAHDNMAVLTAAVTYLKDPPAPHAFGCERYGKIGRVSTKGGSVPPKEGPLKYRCGCVGKTKCCKIHGQPVVSAEQRATQDVGGVAGTVDALVK